MSEEAFKLWQRAVDSLEQAAAAAAGSKPRTAADAAAADATLAESLSTVTARIPDILQLPLLPVSERSVWNKLINVTQVRSTSLEGPPVIAAEFALRHFCFEFASAELLLNSMGTCTRLACRAFHRAC